MCMPKCPQHSIEALDIMVADTDPRVIVITESWANKDLLNAKLPLTGYIMFRKDRRERMGVRVNVYIKDSIKGPGIYEMN